MGNFLCQLEVFNGSACSVQCRPCRATSAAKSLASFPSVGPNPTDAIALAWWRELPPMQITLQEMQALPEYSVSNPTGVIVGKRWRRLNGAFDSTFRKSGGVPRWIICQYESAEDEFRNVPTKDHRGWERERMQMANIARYRPVIRVPARSKEYV
jgi:hypothetical protein